MEIGYTVSVKSVKNTNLTMNPESFTQWQQWELLSEKAVNFGMNLAAALAIFLIGKWLAGKIVRLLRLAMNRAKVDITLVSFLCNVAYVLLLVLVIMTALNQVGVPTTSAAALIGGAGLAVGLSLKDQLSNFAAGALIIFFRPFKVGDYIKSSGFEGYVREIKIAQTSLRTYANEEVVIPNSLIMGGTIINKSSLPLWRAQVKVGVDYACDLKVAKAAILAAATEHPKCLQTEKQASVQITNLADSAIEITLWAWTTEADWWGFQCDLYEQVVENLRAVNINIPFPQQDVHITGFTPDSSK
ncbi:transporter, small conductance mechanosensitive ion channel family [Neisseria weaveri ATCC 51223]|nr:transporter, small conductance mechanosensitive ion channel family [Neisseria weaveri ATCC 51223]